MKEFIILSCIFVFNFSKIIRLWENSKHVAKQLDKIGNRLMDGLMDGWTDR